MDRAEASCPSADGWRSMFQQVLDCRRGIFSTHAMEQRPGRKPTVVRKPAAVGLDSFVLHFGSRTQKEFWRPPPSN